MDIKNLTKNSTYFIQFIGIFCLLYFGTKAVIGLTVPGGYYSPFVAQYFDYPGLLRSSLLNGTRVFVWVLGYDAYLRDAYRIFFVNGKGVVLVYGCLGYGLLSFWVAFILANKGPLLKKIAWILSGCFFIWFINVLRIALVLISYNRNWGLQITMQHHTIFNVAVYLLILIMIWLFQRWEKRGEIRAMTIVPGTI